MNANISLHSSTSKPVSMFHLHRVLIPWGEMLGSYRTQIRLLQFHHFILEPVRHCNVRYVSTFSFFLCNHTICAQTQSQSLEPHTICAQAQAQSLEPHQICAQTQAQSLQPHTVCAQTHSQSLQPHSLCSDSVSGTTHNLCLDSGSVSGTSHNLCSDSGSVSLTTASLKVNNSISLRLWLQYNYPPCLPWETGLLLCGNQVSLWLSSLSLLEGLARPNTTTSRDGDGKTFNNCSVSVGNFSDKKNHFSQERA